MIHTQLITPTSYIKSDEKMRQKTNLESGAAREYVLDKMALWWLPEQIASRAWNDNGSERKHQRSAVTVFPKDTSFASISDEELQFIVELINNRPKKRLNYLTPFMVLELFFS